MTIAVIGAGTYGSYLIDALLKKHPDADITLFDVGDKTIKSEQEIGFYSSLKKARYRGLTDGRFFGFGGASVKWGGQLLTYTDNDFHHPDGFMSDVIRFDMEYKDYMLSKFNIENKYSEKHISDDLFTKTGVWLSALHHDFFKWFSIASRKQVKIIQNCRVVRLASADKKHIDAVIYLQDGIEQSQSFDYYFLTAGAFESARILLSSKLTDGDKVLFSDHLSQKVFRIKGSTMIGDEDYIFRMKGTSLITKRMVGEINDCSFYIHPVYNLDFPFFESIKEVLFKKHFEWNYIWNIFKDIPNVIKFTWSVLILRKMYVLNNEWYLYIDIENPTKNSYVTLSSEKDAFSVPGLDVNYYIDPKAADIYNAAISIATNHLVANGVQFDILSESIDTKTCEDIYHPYGMFHFMNAEEYFNHWDNMLLVSTGCLNRSGGINPTASMFPMIDEFILNHFSYSTKQK